MSFNKHFNFVYILYTGCARLSDIAPEMVVHESYYKIPRARL